VAHVVISDSEVAIAAVGSAADVVRKRFGAALERFDKGAGDFATAADLEAERAVRAVLSRERPDDAIFGEEFGRAGGTDDSRLWLIDPLCGTLNYAAGVPIVAVNAALQTEDGVIAAAVAEPFSGEVFWTDGRRAAVRTNGRNAPLVPSGGSKLVDLNLDPPFPNAPAFRAVTLAADEEFAASFQPRVFASSLALTWVATGQRAAYITDGDVRHSVDFAAGAAICETAGCTISDLRGDAPFEGPDGLIVAADQRTHAALLGLVEKQLQILSTNGS
jgi:myo-inositol-1(or 4)-monophosphatase